MALPAAVPASVSVAAGLLAAAVDLEPLAGASAPAAVTAAAAAAVVAPVVPVVAAAANRARGCT